MGGRSDAGRTMAVLISELIWQKIGAQEDADMTLDLFRTPIYNGGVCATLQGEAVDLSWCCSAACS